MRDGVVVHVRGERIVAIGTPAEVPAPAAEVVELPGTTLMPGLIDAHSHVLLHPYNEAAWNNQVLNEAQSLRVARAVNHLKATLDAGFTTRRAWAPKAPATRRGLKRQSLSVSFRPRL